MHLGRRVILSLVVALAVSGASAAEAQDSSWGNLDVSLARIDYDLSGTGNAAGLAIRAKHDLSSNVRFELGGVFAKPEQQFGPSTLFLPEAQLQYRWHTGRVSP